MSRETEKMFSQLYAQLGEHNLEGMDKEEIESLFQNYMQQYNARVGRKVTAETAKTSDDFLELAEMAKQKNSALRYAKKALQLDPDNLDAESMIAELSARNSFDLLNKLKCAVVRGDEIMKAKGYAEEHCIGEYWGMVETRPYMRLRMKYADTLKDNGMIRRAITEYEEMLRLSENDNLGVRYTLMHLYALMEDEQNALALHKRYDGYEETQMLFPLSILYFKLGDLERASGYLKRLSAANKDTKKFIRGIVNDNMERFFNAMSGLGYRPFTIEELVMEMIENQELFENVPGYFYWADEQLRSKKR